jgi:hypothetical protein
LGREDRKSMFLMHYIVYWFNFSTGKSMFAALHSDIHALKSGLFHLNGQSNSQRRRVAKVKDGIISGTKFLGAVSVE